MRTSRAVPLLLAIVLGATTVGCGSPDESGFGHGLQSPGAVENQIRKLPDGGRVAVGSPDGHRVVVQWKNPDGETWTAPETVYSERLWTHDIAVSVAGDTVAIDPDYWTQQRLDDDYAPDHTAQVICFRRDCAPGHRTVGHDLSGTELNENGTFASFGLGKQVLLWTSDDGFRKATYAGLPPDTSVDLGPGDVFVAVAGVPVGDLCRYDLYVTEPRRTTFTRTTATHPAPGDRGCSASGATVEDGTVRVTVESTGASFRFTPAAGGWTVEEPDISLQAVPDTRGARTLATARMLLDDGTEVALGSPDLTRILAQTRAAGASSWSAPRVVARAPAGTRCRLQSTERTHPGAVSMVSCYPTDSVWKPATARAGVGLALATTDGTAWAVAEVRDPAFEPVISPGGMSLMKGRDAVYLWRSGDRSFTRLPLALDPEWDGVAVQPDGKALIGLTGNGDPSAPCRPLLRTAALDGSGWQLEERVRLPAQFPARGTCISEIYYYGADDTEGTVSALDYSWQYVAQRTTAGWRARPAG